MTGEGIPPLDPSDEPEPMPAAGAYSLTQALENAYYSRDVDTLRRIALQAESQIAQLRTRLDQSKRDEFPK